MPFAHLQETLSCLASKCLRLGERCKHKREKERKACISSLEEKLLINIILTGFGYAEIFQLKRVF